MFWYVIVLHLIVNVSIIQWKITYRLYDMYNMYIYIYIHTMPKTKLVTLGGDAHLDTSLTPMPGRLQWLASQAEGPEPWQFWPSWDKKRRNQHWNSMEQWHAPLTGWPRISPSNQRGAKGANIQAEKHFAWPAWPAWHLQAWHLSTHGSSLCVAGVALMALGWLWWRAWFPGRAGTPRRFAWQAWHFVTSTFTLCGRRRAWWHGSSLCVAGVALAGVALVNTWIVTLRGRRGTYGSGLALVARLVPRPRWDGRAGTPRRCAWQAWHFVTSTFTLCGRRRTWWHGSSLCVAGVALMALGWLWWRVSTRWWYMLQL